METHGLDYVSIHGCALGLTSVVNGIPIKKPWAIVTNCNDIILKLEGKRCPGTHEHPTHQPCAVSDSKQTERCTDLIVGFVQDAYCCARVARSPAQACAALIRHRRRMAVE